MEEKKNELSPQKVDQNWLFLLRPTFCLREPKSTRPTTVYLCFRINSTQFKISLNLKVIPEHFNKKDASAMISPTLCDMENQNNFVLNKKIQEFKSKFLDFLNYLCTLESTTDVKPIIRQYFRESMKKSKENTRASAVLLQSLNAQKMRESSYKIYKTTYDTFMKFLKSVNKFDLDMSLINLELAREFKKYLQKRTVKHPITGETVYVTDDNVEENLTKFITILTYADKLDKFDLDASRCNKIKDSKKDVHTFENKIYLNDEEEMTMMNFPLVGEENDVRNVFVFQLESLQRFSDVEKFMGLDLREIISENGMITLRQKKTSTVISFPVSPIMQIILERVDYCLPVITNVKANKFLKIICEKMQFNTICDCVEKRGGELYKYSCEKWKLVTTHSARRSGISNALLNGLTSEIVSKVSGHHSSAMVDRYNRSSSEDNAKIFAEKMGFKTPKTLNPTTTPETPVEPNREDLNELLKGLTAHRIINDTVYTDSLGNICYRVDEFGNITKM